MPPDTQLRPFNEENPPDYGGGEIYFSVKLEHNGIFCGIGEGLQYASPTVAYIDYCNKDTWSLLWIEDILKQLGYVIDEKLHVYWCLPRKAICEGLVLIRSDADILQMIKAVDNHKTLRLTVDHSDFLRNLREDVIINREQQVPSGICPRKNITRAAAVAESTSKSVEDDSENFYKDFFQEEEDEESDDSDFVITFKPFFFNPASYLSCISHHLRNAKTLFINIDPRS